MQIWACRCLHNLLALPSVQEALGAPSAAPCSHLSDGAFLGAISYLIFFLRGGLDLSIHSLGLGAAGQQLSCACPAGHLLLLGVDLSQHWHFLPSLAREKPVPGQRAPGEGRMLWPPLSGQQQEGSGSFRVLGALHWAPASAVLCGAAVRSPSLSLHYLNYR